MQATQKSTPQQETQPANPLFAYDPLNTHLRKFQDPASPHTIVETTNPNQTHKNQPKL